MAQNKQATIGIDEVRELQKAIKEASYSFGGNGELNIYLTKGEHESHSELRKRVKKLSDQLVAQFEIDPKTTFPSGSQIVVRNPNQNMPFILAELDIPVDWQVFAKDVQVSKSPDERPSGNATLISYTTETPQAGSFASRVLKEDPNLRKPTTWVGKLLLGDALHVEQGMSR